MHPDEEPPGEQRPADRAVADAHVGPAKRVAGGRVDTKSVIIGMASASSRTSGAASAHFPPSTVTTSGSAVAARPSEKGMAAAKITRTLLAKAAAVASRSAPSCA